MKNVIKESPVTIFLLALTTLVFIAMQVIYFGNATSNQAIFNTGGMFGAYVRLFPSQLWRLVTPIFVHIGWEHFFFYMLHGLSDIHFTLKKKFIYFLNFKYFIIIKISSS